MKLGLGAVADRLTSRRVVDRERICVHLGASGICAVGSSSDKEVLGLEEAVGEIVDYAAECIEEGDQHLPMPASVRALARWAAREGVALDATLQALVIGHTFLSEAVCVETDDLPAEIRRQALAIEGAVVRRLNTAISEDYREERKRVTRSPAQRRDALVERLLLGTAVDETRLGYPLNIWHLGLVAEGTGAADAVRSLAQQLQGIALITSRGDESFWAWIGNRQRFAEQDVAKAAADVCLEDVRLALGEPAQGISGCRSTHLQALAAFSVAARKAPGVTLFANVALEAMALRSPDIARSLQAVYLEPFRAEPQGGLLQDTLQAYFSAQRNISSAAAALGVTRRTVENRLDAIESKLKRPLRFHGAELEVAMRVDGLLGTSPKNLP